MAIRTAPTRPASAGPPVGTAGRGGHRRGSGRLVRVLTGTALALVALAAVTTAVLVLVLRIGFSPVLSPSMEPYLAPGDLLLTRAVPAAEVAVGDIVVLPRPDAPGQRYAHRVVALRTDGGQPIVRTRGDNNDAPDPQELRVTSATVPVSIGRVPEVGSLALSGQRAPVRIALIVLIGLAVMVAARRLIMGRPS